MYAVICHLKSCTFSRDTSPKSPEFTCQASEYPDVSVTIPSRSLSEDFTLTMKVTTPKNVSTKEILLRTSARKISAM